MLFLLRHGTKTLTRAVLGAGPLLLIVGVELRVLLADGAAPAGGDRAQTRERALDHRRAGHAFRPAVNKGNSRSGRMARQKINRHLQSVSRIGNIRLNETSAHRCV